ncbi:MAG: Valine-tRNA ligase, partial [Candidatus Woesebacteria bacterium GW2011_GWB1_38_5b]
LRMALVMSTTPGSDKNVGENQIRGMRNFSNKIWNASRYILTKEGEKVTSGEYDQAFTEKLNLVVSEISQQLDNLKIGLASETVYNEFWHWYCDICIEKNKSGELSDEKLLHGLKTFLILLHPFVPFVTEAIWTTFNKDLLITSPWPVS